MKNTVPYSGSIDLISGLRPKNGGAFPLVDAADVRVDDQTRLSDKMAHLDRMSSAFGIAEGEETRYAARALRPKAHKNGILLTLRSDTPFAGVTTYNSGNANHQYSVYDVRPGAVYLATGDVPSSNSSYVVAAFYDGEGAFLSRIEREEGVTAYVDYPVTAPEGAASACVIKYSSSTAEIALKETYALTGSALVDGLVGDMADARDRLAMIETQLDEASAMTPGAQLSPTETVARSLLGVKDKSTYGDRDALGHSFYGVTGGAKYFYTASSATSANTYPAGAFYDEKGNWISSFGQDAGRIYEDVLVTAPADAKTCVLNKNNGLAAVALKEALSPASEEALQAGYNLDIADALIRREKRNPFAFSAFDKGYVTFVFDDLTADIDLVASVFAEYGYPLCLAAIPSRLDNIASGLDAPKGDYAPGMAMREVMAQAVSDGGEILTHNSSPVVTEDSQYDADFMYAYFIQSKRSLEKAGFHPRGIIRAGGANAVSRSAEIDRWLVGNYEYANMGTLPQYSWDRTNTNIGMAAMKAAIDSAAASHTWLRFMCHGLDANGSGEALGSEALLREILDYCGTAGVEVVTCAYMFDQFGSSALEERIKALEAGLA